MQAAFFLQTCLDPHKIHFALKLPQQTGNSSRGKQQPCGRQAGACCAPFFVQSAAFWVESLNRLWQWCASIRRNRRRRHYQTAHRDTQTNTPATLAYQCGRECHGEPSRAAELPTSLPACLPGCLVDNIRWRRSVLSFAAWRHGTARQGVR